MLRVGGKPQADRAVPGCAQQQSTIGGPDESAYLVAMTGQHVATGTVWRPQPNCSIVTATCHGMPVGCPGQRAEAPVVLAENPGLAKAHYAAAVPDG